LETLVLVTWLAELRKLVLKLLKVEIGDNRLILFVKLLLLEILIKLLKLDGLLLKILSNLGQVLTVNCCVHLG